MSGECSIHREKVSMKTSKYLYPPVAGWISVKSISQSFLGVLAAPLDSFLGKDFLFGVYLRTNLTLVETSSSRLSSIGITHLGKSNSESFVDPR